jgi:hypothetical protein
MLWEKSCSPFGEKPLLKKKEIKKIKKKEIKKERRKEDRESILYFSCQNS